MNSMTLCVPRVSSGHLPTYYTYIFIFLVFHIVIIYVPALPTAHDPDMTLVRGYLLIPLKIQSLS